MKRITIRIAREQFSRSLDGRFELSKVWGVVSSGSEKTNPADCRGKIIKNKKRLNAICACRIESDKVFSALDGTAEWLYPKEDCKTIFRGNLWKTAKLVAKAKDFKRDRCRFSDE